MRALGQCGFTLVEVMIAIALMAVVSVMAWRGLDSVSRTQAALERRTDDVDRLLRALDQLDRDVALRATTELPPTDAGLLPASLQVRRQAELPMLLEIVRAAPAAPGQWQRVQWWLRGGVLYRAAGPASAAFPLAAPEASDRAAVLEGVADFQARAWEPGQGWRNLPPAATVGVAATGLEVVLGVRTQMDAQAQRFRRVLVLE